MSEKARKAYSHCREHMRAIDEVKKPETARPPHRARYRNALTAAAHRPGPTGRQLAAAFRASMWYIAHGDRITVRRGLGRCKLTATYIFHS